MLPIVSTHTAVGGRKWAHVLVAGLAAPFALRPSHVPNDVGVDVAAAEPLLAWTGYSAARGAANVTLGGVWTEGSPIALPACDYSDFLLWHASPVVSLGGAQLALLGEPTKWAAVSVARVAAAAPAADASDFVVTVRGDVGEAVELAFATRDAAGSAWAVRTVTCVLPASAEATVHLRAQRCA